MIELNPVGRVRSPRIEVTDDDWDGVVSEIELAPLFGPEALTGILEFSHIEVVYVFDQVVPEKIVTGTRRPRRNPAWPETGIFAQRGKNRPNRLGVSVARLLGCEGTVLKVQGLDAVDGSPVLDIKPVMREFLPRGVLRQPAWSHELMLGYWFEGAVAEKALPRLISAPTRIEAAGQPPKLIEEFIGRVNSGTESVSIARMVSPSGWREPAQTPEFDEFTVVLRGELQVETHHGTYHVKGGEAIVVPAGVWVRYSSPAPEGAEYIAVCVPAFSPATVHREEG